MACLLYITTMHCACSLSVNEIGDEGVIAISSSLSTLSSLQTLRHVLIGLCSINDLK